MNVITVGLLCGALGIAASSFVNWRRAKKSLQEKR